MRRHESDSHRVELQLVSRGQLQLIEFLEPFAQLELVVALQLLVELEIVVEQLQQQLELQFRLQLARLVPTSREGGLV